MPYRSSKTKSTIKYIYKKITIFFLLYFLFSKTWSLSNLKIKSFFWNKKCFMLQAIDINLQVLAYSCWLSTNQTVEHAGVKPVNIEFINPSEGVYIILLLPLAACLQSFCKSSKWNNFSGTRSHAHYPQVSSPQVVLQFITWLLHTATDKKKSNNRNFIAINLSSCT